MSVLLTDSNLCVYNLLCFVMLHFAMKVSPTLLVCASDASDQSISCGRAESPGYPRAPYLADVRRHLYTTNLSAASQSSVSVVEEPATQGQPVFLGANASK